MLGATVGQIGSFVTIKGRNFYFNGCHMCKGHCCNGASGFAMTPLILEDFKEVYTHFPIVFSKHNDVWYLFMVLNDAKSYCRYYDAPKNQCSIYEHRPPACRLYPLSPYFEHIFVDRQCPSVSESDGMVLTCEGRIEKEFYTQRLDNFAEKYAKTRNFIDEVTCDEEAFEYVGQIAGYLLYAYKKPSQNEFLKLHQASLHHLAHLEGCVVVVDNVG